MRSIADWREYQHRALEFAKRVRRGYLAAKAGAGKTSIALALIDYVINDSFETTKVVVFGPMRVVPQWASEAQGWAFGRDLSFVQYLGSYKESQSALEAAKAKYEGLVSGLWGSPEATRLATNHRRRVRELEREIKERRAAFESDAQVMCVSFEFLPEFVRQYTAKSWPYGLVIFDEASRLRNGGRKGSVGWKAINSLMRNTNARLLQMSGSPRPGSAHEMYAPVALMDQGARLGKTLTAFRDAYLERNKWNRQTGQVYSWKLRAGKEAELYGAISDLYFAVAPDLGIPSVTIDRRVRLPAAVEAACIELQKTQVVNLDDLELMAGSQGTVAGKLHQMCQGAVYDEAGEVHHLHDEKLHELAEIIEEVDGPMIIAYWYGHDFDRLRAKFPNAVDITTEQGLADAKAGKVELALLHPGSAAHGIDGLQMHFSAVAWFTVPASFELYDQLNRRIVRSGQAETVRIYRVIAENGIVDERVVLRLAEKEAEQDQFFEYMEAKQLEVKHG